ncbi:hypothetical protein [Bacillus sp. OV322]|uniref:hypothetical protein n=1 Tax=Bacillus sp. OV322 TaxID=1882764 RepID=UPI0015A5C44D|nr:hypothetical protein [Bacillus sp. OV322]
MLQVFLSVHSSINHLYEPGAYTLYNLPFEGIINVGRRHNMINILLIPLITTIFTTLLLYIKENSQGKRLKKQVINEQKLKEVYNELFSISLTHKEKLKNSFYTASKGALDGAIIPEDDIPVIQDAEKWNELINKIRAIVHKNLHLLEKDDLSNWHQIELIELDEKFGAKVPLQKYRQLQAFLEEITVTYKKLYNMYHQ